MDKVKRLSTNHNLSEEKGEPKRYRTEVLPLTNLTPYRQAKPAHTQYGARKPIVQQGSSGRLQILMPHVKGIKELSQ